MLRGDMRDLTNTVDVGRVSSANVVAGPVATAVVTQSCAMFATMSEQLQYELDIVKRTAAHEAACVQFQQESARRQQEDVEHLVEHHARCI